MCTVSWGCEAGSELTVWFNRDEQHDRVPAALPQRWGGDTPWIAAQDPAGGGTWLWANAAGLVGCVLNHYPRQVAVDAGFRSRGRLLWSLADCRSLTEIAARVQAVALEPYRAFHLLVFAPDSRQAWTWDGRGLRVWAPEELPAQGMISTSSVEPQTVAASRAKLWRSLAEGQRSARAFHYHFAPQTPEVGPCMEREDARTVSIAHVVVRPKEVRLDYQPKGRGSDPGAWKIVTTARLRRGQ